MVSTKKRRNCIQRKTEHDISDFDALLNAIKAIKIGKKSIRSTTRDYSIDKSNFLLYVKKLDKELPDITKVSDVELMAVVCCIGWLGAIKIIFNG